MQSGLRVACFTGVMCLCLLHSLSAQPVVSAVPVDVRFKADLLLIVAHPDDETAIGGLLAKLIYDDGKRVAIIYTTRGQGGGNTNGTQQSTTLGLIREIEARRATSAFGITNVWFLNGRDTPGQDVFRSLQTWGHGDILEQAVRLVRLTRPEVIATWLPHAVAGENHGDHQAAGVIATEAYDLAGDPTAFPVQVAMPREPLDIANVGEGLNPWQTKKLYYFSDASHAVEAAGPPFDLDAISRTKNVSYAALAAELHFPHLTQGDVSQPALKSRASGDDRTFRQWLGRFNLIYGKSAVPCDPSADLFAGLPQGPAAYVPAPGFRPESFSGVTIRLGGVYAFYRDFWRAHGIEHVGPLVKPELEVPAGSYVHVPLILTNATADTAVISLEPSLPPGWKEVSGRGTYRVPPHSVLPVQTFIFADENQLEEFLPVVWTAKRHSAAVGSVSVKMRLLEWTLPQ